MHGPFLCLKGVFMSHPLCPECNRELFWGSSDKKPGWHTYRCTNTECKYTAPVQALCRTYYDTTPKSKKAQGKVHYWQKHGRDAA